jgi:lipoprotein LprG
VKKLSAVVVALLLALALAGCRGDSERERLPDAKTLLQRSADAMSKVTSLAFDLNIEGELSSFQIKQATGVIRSDGKARANAQLNQGQQLVEYEYVLVDGRSYLKGPTGPFREVPPEITARFFDPTKLLTGERSLANGLAQSREATTEAEDEVAGVETYRIKATVSANRVEGLALLASGRLEETTLWIDRDTNQLVRAQLPFQLGSRDPNVVTVTFSKFNENVEISPPI